VLYDAAKPLYIWQSQLLTAQPDFESLGEASRRVPCLISDFDLIESGARLAQPDFIKRTGQLHRPARFYETGDKRSASGVVSAIGAIAFEFVSASSAIAWGGAT
jgi:hypothetical protein